jgi:hypothetical protein
MITWYIIIFIHKYNNDDSIIYFNLFGDNVDY